MRLITILLKYIFFVIIFSLVSCKKNSINPLPIAFHWKWIKTYNDAPLSSTNPITPLNSGIQELLIFNSDNTWSDIKNNNLIDSGTYIIGHGVFTNLSNVKFEFDSIQYYRNGTQVLGGVDYYQVSNDTLIINPFLNSKYISYMLPYGGSKYFVK